MWDGLASQTNNSHNLICHKQHTFNFSFVYFLCRYLQAKGILKFIEAISEKTLRSTVAMTAARGRGKSAALGLAIAAAVGFG